MDSSRSGRLAFIKRIKHKNAIILSLALLMGAITSLAISGNVHADTVCYRVKFTQNEKPYHSNSVCREDSGTIKVVDNGNDVFNLFQERNYTFSPDYRDQPSICTHEQMIDKNTKKAVCKLKEGFELNGQTLIDMLKEQCNGVTCEWGNSLSNTNMRLQIGGTEMVTEDEARAVQSIAEVSDPNEAAGRKEKTDEDACYDESGALGWLICPVIEGIGGALSTIYENITPYLTIEPALVSNSSANGTYIAWNIFRTIANWAFVILLLVVIFSQITGLGIDNYGIKKILPKLIVVAILINLSYIICQLAIDLSNILGNGLNSLFTGIAGQINSEASSPVVYMDGLITAVLGVLGIVVVGVGTGAALIALSVMTGQGWALVVPILLTLISGLLSVLFMFITLFIRQALAVLLVAVAPLAFASYVLPNTKRMFFDRWLNIFKGILLLYPLAGALIGGGLLASVTVVTATSSAMANSEGADLQLFFTYLGGIILQVVPFFFLPTLFKSSINAVGNLGNTLSGYGRNLGSGLNKAVSGNESYQAMQARLAAGRPGGWRDRIARSTGLGKNEIARNRMKYDRMMSRQGAYDAMFSEGYALETETANEMRRITASGEIDDVGIMQKGLEEALVSGNKAKIRAYTDALATKKSSGRDAVAKAWNSAARRGVTQEAATTFANNILNNHAADFKSNRGSVFRVATKINGAATKLSAATPGSEGAMQAAQELNDARQATTGTYLRNPSDLFKDMTPSSIGGMDDEEFNAIFGSDGTRIPSDIDPGELYSLADKALADQNANLTGARIKALENLKNQAGQRLQGQATPQPTQPQPQPQPQSNRASSSDYTTNIGETDGGADSVSE